MSFTISQAPDADYVYLYPNADVIKNFTPSEGTLNYALIDDVWYAENDADYIYTINLGDTTDEYELENSSISTGTINNVKLIARVKSVYANSQPTLLLSIKEGSYIASGATHYLFNNFDNFYDMFYQTPSGSTWSWTAVNNLKMRINANIANKELIYKAGATNFKETYKVLGDKWTNGGRYVYVYFKEGNNTYIKIYSISFNHVINSVALNDVATYQIYANTANSIFDFARCYDVNNNYIYLAAQTALYEDDLYTHLIRYDISNNIFTTIATIRELMIDKYGTPKACFIDDKYLTILYTSVEGSYVMARISIRNNTTGALIKSLLFYNQAGIYYERNCDVVAFGTANDYKIFAGWGCPYYETKVSLFRYDGTDLLLKQTITLATNGEIRCCFTDNTYFYVVWWDGSNTKMRAYSTDGNTLTELATVTINNSDNVKDAKYHAGYIYLTVGNALKVYTFNGNSFTLIGSYTALSQLYGLAAYDIFVCASQQASGNSYGYNFALFEPSKVYVSQAYAVVKYTPQPSTVTLNNPTGLNISHSRDIRRFRFMNGAFSIADFGRSAKTLVISGVETINALEKMQAIKAMTHYDADVTISGLSDDVDGNYRIINFEYSKRQGTNNVYEYTLTLEESAT